MTPEEFEHTLAPWLRLYHCPGIGLLRANALLRCFDTPSTIFSQSRGTLTQLLGSERLSAALLQAPSPKSQQSANLALTWLQSPLQWPSDAPLCKAIITQADPRYPDALKHISDPPLLLYALGAHTLLSPTAPVWWHQCQGWLAIVGSRAPSPQGRLNAQHISAAVQQAGLCVVSGLALGIDAAAHTGALQNAKASCLATVAVMGTGIDRIYPYYHQELAQHIARNGVLLSEQALGVGPLASNFPKRNRIITGLAQATLVVEAREKSGSLISARLAMEQGRDVMAIPGSIHAPQSKGCHWLIKQGAKLVEDAADVLEEFALKAPVVAPPTLGKEPCITSPESAIHADIAVHPHTSLTTSIEMPNQPASASLLQAMGYDPIQLEQLQARTGLPTAVLQAQLLELELAQHIERMPGGYYQRIVQA